MHEMSLNINELLDEMQTEQPNDLPANLQTTGVCTDTRRLRAGELFVALKGENFDGHDFIADAVKKGAVAIVAEQGAEVPPDIGVPVIRVEATVHALGTAALMWRRKCSAQVVAVTGSAGKTTTKDMIVAILSRAGAVTHTHATENNEIGVAQTLLRLRPDDDYCVLEFGMRGVGEIDYLAHISRPDVAVITNIGDAHVGLLGSREAVAQAKAEILPYLPAKGAAVLNRDDFFFDLLANMTGARVVSFGFDDADVTLTDLTFDGLNGTTVTVCLPDGRLLEAHLRVPGRHNVLNAAAATAVAFSLGVDAEHIMEGLVDFTGSEMRSQVLAAPGGYTIINDAYNASPTSVPPALEMLTQAPGRKLFVFGDMLELGPFAEESHLEIGRLAVRHGIETMVGVGPMAAVAADHAAESGVEICRASNATEAATLARQLVRAGDTVLVKGSRGMKLEKVVEELLRP